MTLDNLFYSTGQNEKGQLGIGHFETEMNKFFEIESMVDKEPKGFFSGRNFVKEFL